MLRARRNAALAAVLLTPFIASVPVATSQLATTQGAPSYTYQGTVHAVNARAGTLDLITGVGMALRLVHMTTSPTTLFSSSGAGIQLAGLKAGDVVRADCRRTDAGLVASRIEKIEVPRP